MYLSVDSEISLSVHTIICDFSSSITITANAFSHLRLRYGVIQKGRPHEGEGGWQMRTPVLILPVKGLFCGHGGRGGKKWQNFADVLYGWPLLGLTD